MLTNFAILVSNNWNSFTDMFSAFEGNNIGPRFYFGFFFMLSIMVFLNIVVSFIMEIYEVTLEKLDANSDKMENVYKVMEAAPTQEELKTLIRKAKLYDKMKMKRQISFENSSVSIPLTFLNYFMLCNRIPVMIRLLMVKRRCNSALKMKTIRAPRASRLKV